jgi:uncharacterized membrane protein YfcA
MLEDALLGAAIAFCFAAVATPVGVSGAVFLVPVQVSILDTPNPSVTPTNLLYNLIAIPGALWRFHREGALGGPLPRLLVLGTLPGVVAGAVIRVEWLSGPESFLAVIAAVLIPLGGWLLLGRPSPHPKAGGRDHRRLILCLGLAVGTIGGIYGIGGGSILAPILVGLGFSVLEVAPAALAATFLTSLAGVVTFALLSISASGDIAPEWVTGLCLGLGGLAGGYLGAAGRQRVPERMLTRGLGLLALALGVRYAVLAIT